MSTNYIILTMLTVTNKSFKKYIASLNKKRQFAFSMNVYKPFTGREKDQFYKNIFI